MKISRRDFIHAGCVAAAVTLCPRASDAMRGGLVANSTYPNPLLSQRNIINLNFPNEFNYKFINHLIPGADAFGPVGTAFTTTSSTWMQLIDPNGYPNNSAASGISWGSGVNFPASSNFAGPYVVTWDGDGKFQLTTGTWTEASTTTTAVGNANGTTTLSGFSSVIGIAPSFGISGTGVPGGTKIVSVNYSTNTVVVSAAVTAGTGITFTLTNGTYTRNANGTWTNTTGIKPYILVSNSGYSVPTGTSFNNSITGGTAISVSSMVWSGGLVTVTTTSPHGRPFGYSLSLTFFGASPSSINSTVTCTVTGASTYTFPLAANPGSITGTITYVAFATNAAIYRQVDEVDFMPTAIGGNGYVYRRPFKQMMVDLNPGAIRFLNELNPNNSNNVRFEYRSPPSKCGATIFWGAGPAYGKASGTNQYTLAASTGTPGNPNVTLASMQHGEVVNCLMSNAMVRAGHISISAITKANPGQVTATAHGFNSGDSILLVCGTNQSVTGNPYVGMVELNYVPVTITVVDANNFTIGIDTTTFTTFAAGTKQTAYCCQNVTLQVGSGNDRVAYPIVSPEGSEPIAYVASTFAANTYMNFVFDKNIAANRTAGTSPLDWTMGAWVFYAAASAGNPAIYQGQMPIEYCTALVVEINKLSVSQGITNPIHMMASMAPMGLQPVDPDYSTASDMALNAISTIMNGGYNLPGLLTTNASLIYEFANETWNFAFEHTDYLAWLNYVRNGVATTDNTTMSALRSTIMARNIAANSPYRSRTYLTLGMQGSAGASVPNSLRASGGAGTNYFTDAWNTWQGGLTPMSQHDCCNGGSYFDVPNTYANTVTGTGTFTDDSAMFNGTDNSGNGGGNYSGAANPTQAITNFVAEQTSQVGQTIFSYCAHANPSAGAVGTLAALMATYGKRFIGYEGGTDWQCAVGGGIGTTHTITAADNLFLTAINQSSQWATAQINFFNDAGTLSNVGLMPLYTFIGTLANLRWAYAYPDTYATISGTPTEGASLDVNSPMWTMLGTRNQALAA